MVTTDLGHNVDASVQLDNLSAVEFETPKVKSAFVKVTAQQLQVQESSVVIIKVTEQPATRRIRRRLSTAVSIVVDLVIEASTSDEAGRIGGALNDVFNSTTSTFLAAFEAEASITGVTLGTVTVVVPSGSGSSSGSSSSSSSGSGTGEPAGDDGGLPVPWWVLLVAGIALCVVCAGCGYAIRRRFCVIPARPHTRQPLSNLVAARTEKVGIAQSFHPDSPDVELAPVVTTSPLARATAAVAAGAGGKEGEVRLGAGQSRSKSTTGGSKKRSKKKRKSKKKMKAAKNYEVDDDDFGL